MWSSPPPRRVSPPPSAAAAVKGRRMPGYSLFPGMSSSTEAARAGRRAKRPSAGAGSRKGDLAPGLLQRVVLATRLVVPSGAGLAAGESAMN
jgi:hypothetical protein